jgi:hypothetical protein
MLIFKGINTPINLLREDGFYLLESLYSYMTKKLDHNDHSHYYNYKKTNREYWGNGYELLKQIVSLPKRERYAVTIVIVKEHENISYVFYSYKNKSYQFSLERKFKSLHKIMDRLNLIFDVEDSEGIKRKWKYLTFILS